MIGTVLASLGLQGAINVPDDGAGGCGRSPSACPRLSSGDVAPATVSASIDLASMRATGAVVCSAVTQAAKRLRDLVCTAKAKFRCRAEAYIYCASARALWDLCVEEYLACLCEVTCESMSATAYMQYACDSIHACQSLHFHTGSWAVRYWDQLVAVSALACCAPAHAPMCG